MSESTVDNYSRLPEELRLAKQWCIAGSEKAPYVATQSGVHNASIHNKSTWKTFDQTRLDKHATGAPGLGIVLTFEDPWTCIDLDVCNSETQRLKGLPQDPTMWTTQEQIDRFMAIVEAMDSYTEVSTLGWGLHIWVRGRIGAGVKRDGIELYSQERFMICTGNVYRDRPIADRQELLDNMVSQMRGPGYKGPVPLVELDETDTDMEVYERASSAENGAKFNKLCSGDWKSDYPSQSEADLSLMSMFAFYSKSNEQCRRLFRCTALGQREKATKNDRYLDYTLEVIRGRQQREALIDASAIEKAYALVQEMQGSTFRDVAAGKLLVSKSGDLPDIESTIPWPPGLAGAIAGFIYRSAPRPVKEVAIVAALGFLAGVCGKAYNIPQSGLNMYIILVARSGVGKEAMHTGLSLICEELRNTVPAAMKFIDFSDFASGPALSKGVAVNTSFVNVAGEWGRKLKRLASEDGRDGPMSQLRTVMTNLYQKSGSGNMVGGISYSNKDSNIATMSAVSYSMIGETTPGTLYESLTPSMMEDGFLSRFLIVDYTGDRPAKNPSPQLTVDPALGQALQGLCAQSLTLLSRYTTEHVQYDTEAYAALNEFDLECDREINGTNDEAQRQMWNRGHLKVCRLAALLAVADNWLAPVVNIVHAQWALDVVRRDIQIMGSRLENGDVGVDDAARERKVVSVLREYITVGPNSDSYGVPDSMPRKMIVTQRFIQMRLTRAAQFQNCREGSTKALGNTIRALVENGYLSEVDKDYLVKEHGYHGRSYRIISLPPIV